MSELPLQVLYHGIEAPPPEGISLHAGPLVVEFENGDLRAIRLGDREILRRVYVAVRDQNWDTILPRLSNPHVEQGPASFHITFDCAHQRREIDFVWRATIDGRPDGTITYQMAGDVRSTFWRNRIGICVLHPIRECAGQPFVLKKADGSTEDRVFPLMISPHQPALDVRGIAHEVVAGVWADIRFDGDVFEMEDQRNWTDASYKTYSTPLSLPFPVEVKAGEKITQTITLSLRGAVPAVSDPPPQVTIALRESGESQLRRLPRIGLGLASHGQPLTALEVERLRRLNLSHLRVDLHLADPMYRAELRRAAEDARALDIPLEAAVFVTDAAADELAGLARLLPEVRPEVATWLIYHEKEPTTAAHWIAAAREQLTSYSPLATFGSGTNRYFTELNRNRPPVDSVDAVCYSLNPQVHAFDDRSLVETLEGQVATLSSARSFVGNLPIIVSPITLKPRFNPDATAPPSVLKPKELPSSVDPRQMSLLGAAWTVGSLRAMVEGSAASVTYFETTGWQGVLEREGGCPLPEHFRSLPGGAFPLYHVLADAGELAEAEVIPSESNAPLRVVALALRSGAHRRVIVANLGSAAESVLVQGLMNVAKQARVLFLDQTTVLLAMSTPEEYRATIAVPLTGRDGGYSFELKPYAVARIDLD